MSVVLLMSVCLALFLAAHVTLLFVFWFNFHWHLFQSVQLTIRQNCSGNGLVSNIHQAITWINNDGLVYLRMYTSPWPNGLKFASLTLETRRIKGITNSRNRCKLLQWENNAMLVPYPWTTQRLNLLSIGFNSVCFAGLYQVFCFVTSHIYKEI